MIKISKKKQKNLVVCLIIAGMLLLGNQAGAVDPIGELLGFEQDQYSQQDQYSTEEVAQVVRVVDGDTIVVLLNGQEEKVRFIGVDTPESVGKYKNNTEPGGVEASDFVKELLPAGSTVYLTKDVSDTDRYDRLLRYIWLSEPKQENIETDMVNAVLLKEGQAEPLPVKPDLMYEDYFEELYNSR